MEVRYSNAKDMLKISIAGVITNLIFAVVFLCSDFHVAYKHVDLCIVPYSAYINSFMAVFNLIPFGVFDGYKIFMINKKIWAVSFIPSAS